MNITESHFAANSPLLTASVGFDDGPQVQGWYYDADRWNGWLNPWITRESVEIVQNWFNEQGPDDRIDLTWNSDGSLTLVEATWVREDPEGYEPQTILPDYLEDGTIVYQYLAWGYCWSRTNLPQEGDDITFYGEFPGAAHVVERNDFYITWTDGVANEWMLPLHEFVKLAWGYDN